MQPNNCCACSRGAHSTIDARWQISNSSTTTLHTHTFIRYALVESLYVVNLNLTEKFLFPLFGFVFLLFFSFRLFVELLLLFWCILPFITGRNARLRRTLLFAKVDAKPTHSFYSIFLPQREKTHRPDRPDRHFILHSTVSIPFFLFFSPALYIHLFIHTIFFLSFIRYYCYCCCCGLKLVFCFVNEQASALLLRLLALCYVRARPFLICLVIFSI